MDGFSRWIVWLEVQRWNKNPSLVAKYFLDNIKSVRECPAHVYTDPGTENGLASGFNAMLLKKGMGWMNMLVLCLTCM